METRKQRNTNVEVLRTLVMFGILLWHVTVHGYGLAHMGEMNTLVVEHDFINSLSVAMFAPCVDLFVLISGYYGIRFSFKTLARFEGQAIFYSYIMIIGAFLLLGHCSGMAGRLFPIMGNRWWFLTTYVMLFIIAPLLNEGIKRLTESQHRTMILLLVIINCFGYLLISHIPNGSNLQSFILVYIIGRYLHDYKDKFKIFSDMRMIALAIVVCTVINLAAIYLCLQLGVAYSKLIAKGIMLYLSYSNPVILLQAILILCGVLLLKPTFNKRLNSVAKHVFGVYLITEALSMHLYKPLKDIFNDNFILGLSACVVVFVVCLMVEAVRSKVYNALLEKVSYHIRKYKCNRGKNIIKLMPSPK